MKGVWIVPADTLKAYIFVNGIATPVVDQTIWIIEKYDDGYFWGTSYTTINSVPTSKTQFIGSISSNNKVLISFNNENLSVTSIGSFKNNQFIMQMNNLTDLNNNNMVISHWSYMIKITKKSPLFKHLPGVNISVPEFINLFD